MKNILLLALGGLLLVSCNSARPKWNGMKKSSVAGQNPGGMNGQQEPEGVPGSMGPAIPQAGMGLVWKRYRAFESGLADGLNLKREETCRELGKFNCIDQINLAILGGNEPLELGQYERAQNPSVLTAVAVDRVVLTACAARLELDRAAGKDAKVYKHFPLSGSAPDGMQIQMQASEFYRRFLARDPEASELQVLTQVAGKVSAPDKLALALCFAVGTSIENIFL